MTNQDRQNAALPRRETVAAPRRTGSRPVDPRAPRAGANPYLLAYRRLLARHQRLIRRVGIGSAIVVGVCCLRHCHAVVAARQRPHSTRRRHALARLGDRGEFRQPAQSPGRRHANRAHRQRRRGGAHSRHRGARCRRQHRGERAESGSSRLRHEPAQRPYARRKPQSGRRGIVGAHRAKRRCHRLCRRQ